LVARACFAILVLGLLGISSCTKQVPVPARGLGAPTAEAPPRHRLRIAGWVDVDDRFHAVDGYVEARGESLRFVTPPRSGRGLEGDRPGSEEIVHRDSVREVRGLETDYVATVFMVLLMSGIAAAAVAVAALSSLNDEPLF